MGLDGVGVFAGRGVRVGMTMVGTGVRVGVGLGRGVNVANGVLVGSGVPVGGIGVAIAGAGADVGVGGITVSVGNEAIVGSAVWTGDTTTAVPVGAVMGTAAGSDRGVVQANAVVSITANKVNTAHRLTGVELPTAFSSIIHPTIGRAV